MLQVNNLVGFGGGSAAGGEITFVDSTEGVGSATFALPTSLQDDYLVLITGSDTKTHPSITDWTTLYTSTNAAEGAVYGRVVGATPPTTVNVGGDAADMACICMLFRGVDATTPQDVALTVATNASSTPVDAPPITPVTNNSAIVVMGSLDDQDEASSVTFPTDYVNGLANDDGGQTATVMSAWRTLATAGAHDPPAFGGTTSDTWFCVTMALRPA